jgi:O-antigen ligase
MERTLIRPGRRSAFRRVDARALALLGALLLAIAGIYQIVAVTSQTNARVRPSEPALAQYLGPGVVASMDSPVFAWSPGWTVSAAGADPAEPADPFAQPAGVVTFSYWGRELDLLVATGDFWGYLYVTVDGQPANLLPDSRFHLPPVEPRAGYRPLLAPEAVDPEGQPAEEWLRVHWEGEAWRETDVHKVRVEMWRGWGQVPLRAVAIDAQSGDTFTMWPGVALLMVAFWLSAVWWMPFARRFADGVATSRSPLAPMLVRFLSERSRKRAIGGAAAGLLLLAVAVWLNTGSAPDILPAWIPGLAGLGLLALSALVWPALWYGSLLAALPLYYAFALPLMPSRAFNLVDVGVYGGFVLVAVHGLMAVWVGRIGRARFAPGPMILLVAVGAWAVVSLYGAQHFEVAARETRTVFIMGVVLALGMILMLRTSRSARMDILLMIGMWLAGAAAVAAVAAILYPRPVVTLPAEGVMRLMGPYGSPNNLALYLDRTLAVALALAIVGRNGPLRLMAAAMAVPMAAAIVLTFSKGALAVALPVLLVTVAAGAVVLLRKQQRSTQVVWLLGGLAVVMGVALLPFLSSERLQSLFNFASGTGFLRLNLWRSSLQMALDNPWVGVGPDNFLYLYRSGYILPQAWMEPNLNHPHNFVLDWWTRLGVPGLVMGLTFWGVLLASLLRRMLHATHQRESWPALYLGLVAAVVASLAHGLIDASFALPDLMAIWALLTVLATVESPQSLPRA